MRCAGNRKVRGKGGAYIPTRDLLGSGRVAIYRKDGAALLKYGTGSMIMHSANHLTGDFIVIRPLDGIRILSFIFRGVFR